MEPLPGGTPATVCVILDLLDEVDETCPHLVQSCRTLHESSSDALCWTTFPHHGVILMLQKNPKTEAVGDQQ